jgi:hypothetical protein
MVKINRDYLAIQASGNAQNLADLGIADAEREAVIQTALAVLPDVKSWTDAYPVILPQRLSATTLGCAAMCGGLSTDPAKIAAYTRWMSIFSLLIFAWDDLLDDVLEIEETAATSATAPPDLLSSAETVALEMLYRTFPETDPPPAAVTPLPVTTAVAQLEQAFQRFYTELKDACPDAWPLYASYARSKMVEAAAANRQELLWRGQIRARTASYPVYEIYMQNGMLSVDINAIMSVLLLLVAQDTGTGQSSPELETLLDRVAGLCGYIIRLANDIRSLARDKVEQKANAVLVVLAQNPQLQEEEAIAYLTTDRDVKLSELSQLVGKLHDAQEAQAAPFLPAWSEAQLRTALFAVSWYKQREFHHFSRAELSALL